MITADTEVALFDWAEDAPVVVNGKRARPRIARAASRRAGSSDASDRLFVARERLRGPPELAREGKGGASNIVLPT